MMNNIECENCGATDFFKEAGFFYCKFCQVQSQEVQEYVFDEFAVEQTKGTKKLPVKKTKKIDKITSWECYNYVLLGLTEELINLGADPNLKSVVKILWLQYLEKLEVFKLGKDVLPKLQPTCSALDAEIIYGKMGTKKRKRRRSSSSETSGTVESSSLKTERIRRKRALIKAQYQDFSQKSQGTSSLQNETLTSIQSSEKKSTKMPVSYNRFATKELYRIKNSKLHWKKHRSDFENTMKCHRTFYRHLSSKYIDGVYNLSLNKLYAILYLGLLIVKDKIQLGDMLRFIKEGHLSFNNYSHFFPEEFSHKILNFRNFKKNCVFNNFALRFITSEMSIFLNTDHYISCSNLVELCERYCKELNLPKEINNCVLKIISSTGMTMSFRKRKSRVPNYEARVLSLIIFVLKLFFGLDDVTEFCLGKYSDILNRTDCLNPKMFNIIEWLRFIEYRDTVICSQYFPASFDNDPDVKNVNLSLSVFQRKENPEENLTTRKKDKYKELLQNLKNEMQQPEYVNFLPTLTPYSDYTKTISNENYLPILYEDFTNKSLSHVLRPSRFLRTLNKKCDFETVHGGANDNWNLEKVVYVPNENELAQEERNKYITVKFCFDPPPKAETIKTQNSGHKLKKDFAKVNKTKFDRNSERLKQIIFKAVGVDFSKLKKELKVEPDEYLKHYFPYERFWLRTKLGLYFAKNSECREFLSEFPYNFQLVFKECQRIAQQNEKELMTEYQMTELYLVYVVNYGCKNKKPVVRNGLIAKYLNRCKDLW